MVNSLLDDVNELLRLSYGDENRLEDIKRRLEDGLTIYNSDINYLKKLVENHKDEIQENTESESTTTESESTTTGSEPLPVDDELEELEEEKTREKHSGGNLKKMGFVILATAAVISVFFAIGSLEEKGWIGSDEPTKTTIKEQPKVTTPEVKPFSQMNEQELEELAIPWSYNDIVRNPEKYYGEILFIEGNVQYISKKGEDRYYLAIAKQCGSPAKFEQLICDYGVIDYSGKRILKGDHIQSYGTLSKIIEQWPRFQPAPVIKSSFLECFNCN